ncbi:hypothetical protein FACS1894171_0860 [Clostridia bacterium]|nr:hypothetical protein FACS1894171_0860 [Clostridia bacterium]
MDNNISRCAAGTKSMDLLSDTIVLKGAEPVRPGAIAVTYKTTKKYVYEFYTISPEGKRTLDFSSPIMWDYTLRWSVKNKSGVAQTQNDLYSQGYRRVSGGPKAETTYSGEFWGWLQEETITYTTEFKRHSAKVVVSLSSGKKVSTSAYMDGSRCCSASPNKLFEHFGYTSIKENEDNYTVGSVKIDKIPNPERKGDYLKSVKVGDVRDKLLKGAWLFSWDSRTNTAAFSTYRFLWDNQKIRTKESVERDTIIKKMKYYADNNPSIQKAALEKGTVIFAFEGAGNEKKLKNEAEYTQNRYDALFVVIKDGAVTYSGGNWSTLPDVPKRGATNGGDDVPTILPGVYEFVPNGVLYKEDRKTKKYGGNYTFFIRPLAKQKLRLKIANTCNKVKSQIKAFFFVFFGKN